ncbi:unnamed protein product [Spirodela intermedia]|uniref:Uncharacterized protein n=1 Tax=Spirodela intermedia TaxID=51605 RepID=A0A7I8J324_SPIIN|nr:unnamed protein product [Spirodela intermedia]CAA6664203.1 unnamed protein product [Spirodela intermedia]
MRRETIAATIQHWINSGSPRRGLAIHSQIIKTGELPNANISIKLLVLHLKCDSLAYARQVFDQMPPPLSLRTTTSSAALQLLRLFAISGERPDGFTLSMALKISSSSAAAAAAAANLCKEVHAQIFRSCGGGSLDEVLCTALIDSYAKNGSLGYARSVFRESSDQNVACCTAMISGYMRRGLLREAEEVFQSARERDAVAFNAMIEGYSCRPATASRSLEVFKDMQGVGHRPTVSTFVSLIGACSVLCALEFGRQVHARLVKTEILLHVRSGSALVDMYAKCGRTDYARRTFDDMPERNVFSWSSMIDGYGKNGMAEEALELFRKMEEEDDYVVPNEVTFLAVLSACGHAGLVGEGKDIMASMERDYSVKPKVEHYACMEMPCRPNSDVWAALLGVCRLHGEVELAAVAAKEVFELNRRERPGAYVALSNTFAAAGRWGASAK